MKWLLRWVPVPAYMLHSAMTENDRKDSRIRDLESINTYLCETLEEIKWSCNQVDVDAASWLAQAALVKVRGEK